MKIKLYNQHGNRLMCEEEYPDGSLVTIEMDSNYLLTVTHPEPNAKAEIVELIDVDKIEIY